MGRPDNMVGKRTVTFTRTHPARALPIAGRPLRGLFRTVVVISLLVYGLAANHLWSESVDDCRALLGHVNARLVEGVRSTLGGHELALRSLGSALVDRGLLDDPRDGEVAIRRLRPMLPTLAGLQLVRADGRVILADAGARRWSAPRLAVEPGFRECLNTGRMSIGRPEFLPPKGPLVMPLWVPIHDRRGAVVAVVGAGYRVDAEVESWANLPLPAGVHVRLLRDDGYLGLARPVPGAPDRADARAIAALYGQRIPASGLRLLGDLPRERGLHRLNLSADLPQVGAEPGEHYVAVERLDEHGLWSATLTARRTVVRQWIESLVVPSGVLVALLVVAGLAYRRAASQQAANDSRLTFLANHDSLTRLPNRSLLHAEIARLTSAPGARPVALILLDLNRFKEINDTLGHHAGDVLLCQIGPRLRCALADRSAIIARLGGDEFTVVLPGLVGRGETLTVARSLLHALLRPYRVEGMQLEIGAALGIAFFPADGRDSHALLGAADAAMYAAKRRGNGIALYDPNLDSHTPDRVALNTELGSAIDKGELVLHYQPKIDLASGQVRGIEALVRWQHPQYGLLYPKQFMHLAEVSETIHRLTEAVLRQALEQAREWKCSLPRPLPVSVNVSLRNLVGDRLLATLREMMCTYGTGPGELQLEITEPALLVDPEHTARLLADIAALGVGISVDDFGNGYSSIGDLHRLPISELKIERLFVADMRQNEHGAAIVRSTIGLAHNLELDVVAEGVEDEPTLSMLRDMGCDLAQGNVLSRPLGGSEIASWLRDAPRPRATASI